MHDWLSIHEQAKKVNPQASDLCPVCVEVKETSQHLFQCKHKSSVCDRIAALTQLSTNLTALCTAPILKDVITSTIATWCGLQYSLPTVPMDTVGMEINTTQASQLEIGWDNFLKGRVSTH
eukprot:5212275-Ditylum_brightwellii.AAC.1